jgi:CRP-like cAMP-binding protein
MTIETTELRPLAHKLALLARLDDAALEAITALPFETREVDASHHLVREGQTSPACCLLLEGYACRHKLAADGGRQIVSFHMRGDLLDAQHLLLSIADHNVQTITRAKVAWIPKTDILRLTRQYPVIAEAIWKDTLIDASVFREWVLNVGRRDAKSRIAHMLCEFVARCEVAGLGSPDSFEVPMTQEQIADATGLTPVHVNRMIGALERDGVIARDKRQFHVADWAKLRDVADFRPEYLHSAAA